MDSDIKFTSICQCCLADDAPMKNMLTEIYHEVKLIETFKKCSGIDLLRDQPKETCKNICPKCESNLMISIEFRELCHTSQKKLKERLVDSIKEEPTSDDEPLVLSPKRGSSRSSAFFTKVFLKKQPEGPVPSFPKIEDSKPIPFESVVQVETVQNDDDDDDFFNNENFAVGQDSDSEDDSAPSAKIVKLEDKKPDEENTEPPVEGEPDETATMPVLIMCYHCDEFLKTQKDFVKHRKNHLIQLNKKKANAQINRNCFVCKKAVTGYAMHLKKEHRGFKPHTCEKCKMTFNRPEHLLRHLYRHVIAKRFKCLGCAMNFKSKTVLHMHTQKVKHSKCMYHCTGCGLGFKEFIILNEHYQKDHKNEFYKNLYPCYRCKRIFIVKDAAQDHKCKSVVTKKSKNTVACPQCSKKFTNDDEMVCHKFTFCELKVPCTAADCTEHFKTHQDMTSHVAEQHKVKNEPKTTTPAEPKVRKKVKMESHICDQCGLVLSNIWNLRKHKLLIHDPNYINERKLYPCNEPSCEKVLRTKHSFDRHVAIFHSGRRKFYECYLCPKRFRSLVSIRTHICQNHLSDTSMTFTCIICQKNFVTENARDTHFRIHRNAAENVTFTCDKCPSSFRSVSNLRVHQQRAHEGRYYECCYCQNHFSAMEVLKYHMYEHRGFKPFSCPVCPSQFVRQYLFVPHLKKHGITFDKTIHGYVEQEDLKKLLKSCERNGMMDSKKTSNSNVDRDSY